MGVVGEHPQRTPLETIERELWQCADEQLVQGSGFRVHLIAQRAVAALEAEGYSIEHPATPSLRAAVQAACDKIESAHTESNEPWLRVLSAREDLLVALSIEHPEPAAPESQ